MVEHTGSRTRNSILRGSRDPISPWPHFFFSDLGFHYCTLRFGCDGRTRTSTSCLTGRRATVTRHRSKPDGGACGSRTRVSSLPGSRSPVGRTPRTQVSGARARIRAELTDLQGPRITAMLRGPATGAARGTRTRIASLRGKRVAFTRGPSWSRLRESNPHLLRTREPCDPPAPRRRESWSGKRDSNPHLELGTLALSH